MSWKRELNGKLERFHMKSNGKNKAEKSIIRSSAAEYLTFITAPGEGGIEAIYADENVWLTQKMMGVLYNVQTHTINYHLKKVFSDGEIDEESATRNFRITATDGKMYDTKHYNLKAIIVVWYKVNSERAVQFRKWATSIIEEFTVKAYVMDEWATSNASSSTSLRFFALLVAPCAVADFFIRRYS